MNSNFEGRQRELYDLVLRTGPPLFVPGGVWRSVWKIGGYGLGQNDVERICSSARDTVSRTGVRVDTLTRPPEVAHESSLVRRLVSESVPDEIRFPLTIVVRESLVDVGLGRAEKAELRLLQVEKAWIAFGAIDNRWVEVWGDDVSSTEISLERVTDFSGLAHQRFD